MTSIKKKMPAHTRGSGNIFANLGLPGAQELRLKAVLMVQLKKLTVERKMRQAETVKLAELKQPEGPARSATAVSVKKLLRTLTAFDRDVQITLKHHRKRGEAGRIMFVPA